MSFMSFFWILFVILLFFESRILFRNKHSSHDRGSLQLFTLIGYALIVAVFLLYYLGIGSFDSAILKYAGLVLLVGGFALRQWSISVLGKFFIPVVDIQKTQKVIDYGPYHYLRHPSYAGLFLELLGFSLVLLNWVGIILVFGLFLPVIFYRIKIEEDFLFRHLTGYKRYIQRTWKLIPFVY